MIGPEASLFGLVGRPRRAHGRTERLHLVELRGVRRAVERERPGRREHRRVRHEERIDIADPLEIVARKARGQRPPFPCTQAFGERARGERRRPWAAVVLPGLDHRGRRGLADLHTAVLVGSVGDERERGVVGRGQLRRAPRKQTEQDPIGGGRSRGVLRVRVLGVGCSQIRLEPAVDGVHGVEHRPMDHREVQRRDGRRLSGHDDQLLVCVPVPSQDLVGDLCGRCWHRRRHDDARPQRHRHPQAELASMSAHRFLLPSGRSRSDLPGRHHGVEVFPSGFAGLSVLFHPYPGRQAARKAK